MFEKYTKKTFDLLKKQHNILVLVGNGFDVALLKKHNVGKMKGKTSSYIDFYEYIRYYNFSDENNILFKQMTRDREEHRNDWSDFELTIKRLVERPDISVSEIERCVDEFQTYFTRFLNDLVDADVLLEINKDSKDKKLAIQGLIVTSNYLATNRDRRRCDRKVTPFFCVRRLILQYWVR